MKHLRNKTNLTPDSIENPSHTSNGRSYTERYAVVTGANKAIGFEICRQLASHGITVVLAARDEKRGLDALHSLKSSDGLSGDVLFHQLDVSDSSSVASLAEFIKMQFGKLDILVNNAGNAGAIQDPDALRAATAGRGGPINWKEIATQTYESAVECLQTNYYGPKRMVEACLPLLQSSQSPRIVNVSSLLGKLEFTSNAWAKGVLGDAENLTEDRVDEVLNEYLKDLKAGCDEAKGWHSLAYTISKAALNAYTRIVAKKFPSFKVNCLCPGFVKTELNYNIGFLTVEGAESPVRLALLPDDGPSCLYFRQKEVSSYY